MDAQLPTNPQECLACKPAQNKTISTNEKGECVVCGKKLVTPSVKFDLSFTPRIDEYIASTDKPTVKGFANLIGTDVFSLWSWANKKKKDEQGNLTDELARPKFHAALTKLDLIEKQSKEEGLNAKQELFCQLYATNREFFGNGVESYLEVYDIDRTKPNWYKTACAAASRLLSDVKVYTRINELLEDGGLNDQFVDKQILFLVAQHEDKGAKIAAIREYNKLKQRITEKIDHTSKGKEMGVPIYGGKATE